MSEMPLLSGMPLGSIFGIQPLCKICFLAQALKHCDRQRIGQTESDKKNLPRWKPVREVALII